MKNYYIHVFIKNKVLFSTLPEELREEAEKSEYIYKNCICPVRQMMKRQNKEAVQDGYIYMCSYDTSMTSKIFSYYFDMLRTIHIAYQEKVKMIEGELIKDVRRLQHNVNTYNATIQDEITNLVPLDDIHNNWKEVVLFVEEIIKNKPRATAITLLKAMKFSTFITAEMTVHDYINADAIKLEIYPHSIHRIIKLSLQPYFLEFVENKIDIKINDCYEKVLVDYPTISVILGHLWNNAIKYVHPNSTLDINFHSNGKHLVTKIKMFSLKIENEEIEDIYKEGYSGKWAKMISKEGHGIGMFYIKRLTEMNGGYLNVQAGITVTKINGIPYAYNEFCLSLPREI